MQTGFIGIGVLELLIIAVIGIGMLAIPIVLVLLLTKRRGDSPHNTQPNVAPCPGCAQLIQLGAKFCSNCGQAIKPGAK
ncbi:MAG: zinc ribbon domain-containing protein [Pirellulaceae bacterium]